MFSGKIRPRAIPKPFSPKASPSRPSPPRLFPTSAPTAAPLPGSPAWLRATAGTPRAAPPGRGCGGMDGAWGAAAAASQRPSAGEEPAAIPDKVWLLRHCPGSEATPPVSKEGPRQPGAAPGPVSFPCGGAAPGPAGRLRPPGPPSPWRCPVPGAGSGAPRERQPGAAALTWCAAGRAPRGHGRRRRPGGSANIPRRGAGLSAAGRAGPGREAARSRAPPAAAPPPPPRGHVSGLTHAAVPGGAGWAVPGSPRGPGGDGGRDGRAPLRPRRCAAAAGKGTGEPPPPGAPAASPAGAAARRGLAEQPRHGRAGPGLLHGPHGARSVPREAAAGGGSRESLSPRGRAASRRVGRATAQIVMERSGPQRAGNVERL